MKNVILLINELRHILNEYGFNEYIVPVLSRNIPHEDTIYPFITKWNKNNKSEKLYLQTSPEYYLKKYISKYNEDCYSFGYSFRDLESEGKYHNPEFIMLEIYKLDQDYVYLMGFIKEILIKLSHNLNNKDLINNQINHIITNSKWEKISIIDLFINYAGISYLELISLTKMIKFCDKLGYEVKNFTWEQMFNKIFLNLIEPNLPREGIYYLIDYPSKISPLCNTKTNNSEISERFELYINGIEIANGCTEPKSVNKVNKNLKKPLDIKLKQDLTKINAKHKIYSGVGIGIDRLSMFLNNKNICDFSRFDYR